MDDSLSPLEALEVYGRSPVFEQCLAYIGSAAAAAAGSSSEDIMRVVLPLLQDALAQAEPLVCIAALRQLPAVGAPRCALCIHFSVKSIACGGFVRAWAARHKTADQPEFAAALLPEVYCAEANQHFAFANAARLGVAQQRR